mmetsp:Transcript_6696/g.28613  ORF Transcript_6696/g.28613 Transcript_6696/m.28613 type:complete len:211 (-) Transcript_6696:3335-3967(-)
MDRSAGFVGSGQLLRSGRASGKGTAVCMSAERPAAASRRDVLLGIAGTIGVALGSSQPTLAAEGLAGKVDPYQDAQKGFKILKPSGWNEFSASENFDVKWQDIINPVEQITVITTPVTKGKTVADIGTSEEVAAKLSKSRSMEVVGSSSKENQGIMTYVVEMKSKSVHQITVLAINRSKLYTVNITCPENRWSKREKLMKGIAESFVPRL